MATVKTMNVSLTPQLEDFARGLVKSGRYNSASEVVRESLRLLEEREAKHERLRRLIQEGIESPSRPYSGEALRDMIQNRMAELRQEVAEGKRPDPKTNPDCYL